MNLLNALIVIYCMSGNMVNQNDNLFAPLIQAVVPQKSEWRQLFNGKDLTGWKHIGPGDQYVEDGLIKSHGGM